MKFARLGMLTTQRRSAGFGDLHSFPTLATHLTSPLLIPGLEDWELSMNQNCLQSVVLEMALLCSDILEREVKADDMYSKGVTQDGINTFFSHKAVFNFLCMRPVLSGRTPNWKNMTFWCDHSTSRLL